MQAGRHAADSAARSAEFVQMMPLRGIPGIGPSLEKRLNAWGVHSVAELAQLDEAALTRATGSPAAARGLWAASHGLDSREITTVRGGEIHWVRGNLGRGYTRYARGVWLLRSACDEVTSTAAQGLVARTLTVKLRFADLSYQTRSFTMERPTDTAGVLYGMRAAAESHAGATGLGGVCHSLPKTIRLAGMSTSSLSKAAATAVQPSLDDMLEEADNARGQTSQARLHDAEAALDAVRRKFGNKAAQFGA